MKIVLTSWTSWEGPGSPKDPWTPLWETLYQDEVLWGFPVECLGSLSGSTYLSGQNSIFKVSLRLRLCQSSVWLLCLLAAIYFSLLLLVQAFTNRLTSPQGTWRRLSGAIFSISLFSGVLISPVLAELVAPELQCLICWTHETTGNSAQFSLSLSLLFSLSLSYFLSLSQQPLSAQLLSLSVTPLRNHWMPWGKVASDPSLPSWISLLCGILTLKVLAVWVGLKAPKQILFYIAVPLLRRWSRVL